MERNIEMDDINEIGMVRPDSHGLLPCAYCGASAARDGRRSIHCTHCGRYSVDSSHPVEEWNLHMAKVAAHKVLAGRPKVIEVRVACESEEEYNPLHVTIVNNVHEHWLAPKWRGGDGDDINRYSNRREVDR